MILDVGCGQRESCLALAMQVGPLEHVTGLDPAPAEYSHPFTMQEAHEYIQKSTLRRRISFHHGDGPFSLDTLDG